jgi:hypothetical protein
MADRMTQKLETEHVSLKQTRADCGVARAGRISAR